MAPSTVNPRAGDWMSPPAEQEGLKRYVDTIRERARLILTILAITTGGDPLRRHRHEDLRGRGGPARDRRRAEDTDAAGPWPLITQSSDPTRDVEHGSAVRDHTPRSPSASPTTSASRADPEQLLDNVDRRTRRPEQHRRRSPPGPTRPPTPPRSPTPSPSRPSTSAPTQLHDADRRDRLPERSRSMQKAEPARDSSPSRSARSSSSAAGPTRRSRSRPRRPSRPLRSRPARSSSIFGGLVAGLVLGVGRGLRRCRPSTRRLRREEQLRRLYRLPILARIPRETKRTRNRPLGPRSALPRRRRGVPIAARNRLDGPRRQAAAPGDPRHRLLPLGGQDDHRRSTWPPPWRPPGAA